MKRGGVSGSLTPRDLLLTIEGTSSPTIKSTFHEMITRDINLGASYKWLNM